MPKLNMTPKELIRILQESGSHAIFKNDQKKKKVVVPIHNKNIPNGTLHSILKDSNIHI